MKIRDIIPGIPAYLTYISICKEMKEIEKKGEAANYVEKKRLKFLKNQPIW